MSSMSGDDDGQKEAIQENSTEPDSNDKNGDWGGEISGINIESESEEASAVSSIVRETEPIEVKTKQVARPNDSPVGQSARQAISRDWEDASDSVPDDLPSVNVSVVLEAALNWL